MPVVQIPVYLPAWLLRPLKKLKRVLRSGPNGGMNLLGDREVEWSFVAAHLSEGPGMALDFGCGPGYMALVAARRGYEVLALDLEPQRFYWQHSNVRLIQGDLFDVKLLDASFDVVINCSSVEHVGLAGRYSAKKERADGDLEAMRRMRALMKQDGTMLLTVPAGRDATFPPMCGVYGTQRLPHLLEGFHTIHEEFWLKERGEESCWVMTDREQALRFEASADISNPHKSIYALGCFVLRGHGG